MNSEELTQAKRRIVLTEYETQWSVFLTKEELRGLQTLAPSIDTRPAADHGDHYHLTPGSEVGTINLGATQIEIRPKLPIDRVLFLISYSLDPKMWLKDEVAFEHREFLVEAVVPAFVSHVRRAFRRGVLQGYRTEEDVIPIVRGRIQIR